MSAICLSDWIEFVRKLHTSYPNGCLHFASITDTQYTQSTTTKCYPIFTSIAGVQALIQMYYMRIIANISQIDWPLNIKLHSHVIPVRFSGICLACVKNQIIDNNTMSIYSG